MRHLVDGATSLQKQEDGGGGDAPSSGSEALDSAESSLPTVIASSLALWALFTKSRMQAPSTTLKPLELVIPGRNK